MARSATHSNMCDLFECCRHELGLLRHPAFVADRILPSMPSGDQEVLANVARLLAAGDGAVLGVILAAVAASSWRKYVANSSALRRIAAAPTSSISGLRSLLPSSSGEDRGETDEILVVVRGRVQTCPSVNLFGDWGGSSKALIPRGSDEKAVAILDTQTCLYNEWRGIFGWSFDIRALIGRTWKEQRSSLFRSVPFVLVEEGGSDYVHVNLEGSTQQLPLTTVYHELHPIMATPYTIFQAVFGNGYPVALLDEEKILAVGKNITAIGIYKPRDGLFEIKACQKLPYFLSDLTKDEIMDKLNSSSAILFWSGMLIGTFSIGILGYSIIRNWWRWKAWRRSRRIQNSQSGLPGENLIEQDDASDEELHDGELRDGELRNGQLCVVCLTSKRTRAFLPCGHLVCCRRCALSVECVSSPTCPICRESIRSSIRIYAA